MPYGNAMQNWASNNGWSYHIGMGTPTVANLVNGNFDRPLNKILGALPEFDPNRSEPLHSWEIIEINWKDFAQWVGPINTYGFSYQPRLYDAINSMSNQLSSDSVRMSELSSSIASASDDMDSLAVASDSMSLVVAVYASDTAELSLQGTDGRNLTENPMTTRFNVTPAFRNAYNQALTGQDLIAVEIVKKENQQTELSADLAAVQSDYDALSVAYDKAKANTPIDELGLTDVFMHAVYTEFLKQFWGENIAQRDPEYWVLILNNFLGNYLPFWYKICQNIQNSDDFSSLSIDMGGGSTISNSNSKTALQGEAFADGIGEGISGNLGAVANTPQTRLNINARNIGYANNVSNGQADNINTESSVNSNRENSDNQTNSNIMSNNNGKRSSMDTLAIFQRVAQMNGLFMDLWNKARSSDWELFNWTYTWGLNM